MIIGSMITKNEAEWIGYSLQSMCWMDKIILVDNGSTDATLNIALKFKNVEIIKVDINLPHSVAIQRNESIKNVSKDAWVYFSDGDEIITKELADEIKEIVKDEKRHAYQIPRINVFLGKALKHGGFYPDPQLRLIKRANIINWVNGPLDLPPIIYEKKYKYLLKSQYGPHDKPLLKEGTSVGLLTNPYLHYNHRDIEKMILKTPRFLNSELSYKKEYKLLKTPSYFDFIFQPLKEFIRRYIYKQGFMDGIVGLIEALYMAFSTFLFLVKEWELTKSRTLETTYSEFKTITSLKQFEEKVKNEKSSTI